MGKIDGKALIEESKNKVKNKKKETNMKKLNINWTVVKTVIFTLLTLVTIVGLMYAGWELRGHFDNSLDETVKKLVSSEVAQLKQ